MAPAPEVRGRARCRGRHRGPRKARLSRFIRTKYEVNKDAVLADPKAIEGIQGISLRQGEDFVVEPWDTKLEEVA